MIKKILGKIIIIAFFIGALVTKIIRIMYELQVGLFKAIGITAIEVLIILVLATLLVIAMQWAFDD